MRSSATSFSLGCALALATLAPVFAATAGTPDQAPAHGTVRRITFVGTVLEVAMGFDEGSQVVPIGFDPRFRLPVRVEEWRVGAGPYKAGSTVIFAIHSPSLLFGAVEPGWYKKRSWVGKRYLFTLSSEVTDKGTAVTGLRVDPWPAAVKPSH
ncbi:MAG TPA: hypothetical protein VOA87_19110 [Thermoanaerobaculia bacterium]|nr:hypothetical protein [Thermoanaerobaculia bacterium]